MIVVVTLLDSDFPPLLKKGLHIENVSFIPFKLKKNQSLRRRQMRMKVQHQLWWRMKAMSTLRKRFPKDMTGRQNQYMLKMSKSASSSE